MSREIAWGLTASARVLVVVFASVGVSARAGEHPPIRFAEHVRPILQKRCASCHAGGNEKGGFSLETRQRLMEGGKSGPVVVPGSATRSRLVALVAGKDPALSMPPKGERLTADEIAVLSMWIEQGAPWDGAAPLSASVWSAPLEPRRPELPESPTGLTHPIDRIVEAYQRQRGIESGPLVDDVTFLRRATLDIVGLLPTPEEVERFVTDGRAEKRTALVTLLLDRRRDYAEHWLSFWNDLLRNDYEGTGYIDGGRKAITDWLYRSLLENKPYDRFVRELISPTAESEGFSFGIQWRGRVNASQVRELQFAQNVSQVFLGINMKCASCHDSFVSEWKLADAYGLAAIYAEGPLQMYRCDIPTGQTAKAKFLFPQLGDVDPAAPREERLARLATLIVSEKDGRFTRTVVNRIWARLMGRGIVEPVDVMDNEPWSADLLDGLAVYLSDGGFDLKSTIELIATSRTYQSRCAPAASEDAKEYAFRGPELRRMTAEQFVDAVWSVTGTAPAAPDAKVSATEPASFVRASLKLADPLMRALGRPNREQVVSTRPAVMTTLEALELTNGEVLAGILARGAKSLLERGEGSVAGIVRDIYVRALSRQPSADELAAAIDLVGSPPREEGIADLLWAVFMLPEFQLIH